MPEFNEQLARNALKRIKENPQEWDQGQWRCSSGMCFAGYAAFEAGAVWAYDDPSCALIIAPDGTLAEAAEYAAEQLSIEWDVGKWLNAEDKHLFDPGNTIEDLESLIDELSGENPYGS